MIIQELRQLIIKSAPDPGQAAPVRSCSPDDLLDTIIPFSSIIILGTIIAVEDRFNIKVTRDELKRAFNGGVTLKKLAAMISDLKS